ncbi:MAG TPA: DivIVA domain-containing protein [Ruminiclostridium sp.]|nr:DivIVA domain-containing protein [Ruminiclostridium sp.]
MNYTPEELKEICLKRSIVDGYCKKQVNNLLALINEDYSRMVNDNEELKRKITVLDETIKHYKLLEESLQHSILVAQHTSDQIKANACEKAKNITDEAEITAQRIIANANQEVVKAKARCEEAKAEFFTFKSKTEALLQTQMEMLKQMFNE